MNAVKDEMIQENDQGQAIQDKTEATLNLSLTYF